MKKETTENYSYQLTRFRKIQINFLYYLYNFYDIKQDLINCFGNNLGCHFNDKLTGKMYRDNESQFCRPAHIIDLMMEMTDDNKCKFLDYIEKEYTAQYEI